MALEHFGKVLAKSEPKDSNLESLYLIHHIKEVLEKFIDWQERIKDINLLGLGKEILEEENFQKAVAKALVLHDLGKISYEFQRKIISRAKVDEKLKKEWWKHILGELEDIKNINIGRHEIYSLIWSILFLDNPDECTPLIRTAILYHHYNDFYLADIEEGLDILLDRAEDVVSYLKFIKKKKDKVVKLLDNLLQESSYEEISEILQNLKENFSAKIADLDEITYCFLERENLSEIIPLYNPGVVEGEVKKINEKDYKFILLLGTLRRCDYTGSSGVDIEKDSKKLFGALEKAIPQAYQWQKEIVKEITNNPQKNHVIISAPTGSGKTELAFLWGALNKERKFIYTLPLRVALNDIYTNRVLDNYLKKFKKKEDFVGLLHSTSFLEELNRQYRGDENIDIEIKENTSRVFSYPFLLTTADQVFLSSLFYYGFDSLFAIYPYSCFVIDEIQSYTPEMMAIIFKTLQHIDKLGGKILIMTATPPPYLEKIIREGDILEDKNVLDLEKKVKEIAKSIKNWERKRHKIVLRDESLVRIIKEDSRKNNRYDYKVSEFLLEDVNKRIKDNNKNVLIIVNNVMKAIKVYEEIVKKNAERKERVFLLHSRLLEIEKQKRIEELKKKVESEKGIVLVATQIVEASVDLDFDLLYTEISPIDSQIQRWGRVYRNRDKDYEGKEPNIVVYLGNEDEKDLSLRFSKVIYSSDVLEKTKEVLEKKFNNNEFADRVFKYEDERMLLYEVFDNDLLQRYINDIYKIIEFLNYFKASKKSQAQRIFRRLAGRYVVFLEPMLKGNGLDNDGEMEKDDKERKERENVIKLAKYIKENIHRLGDITWKEIESRVFNGTLGKNYKYLIKKWLSYYSVNIPEYYFSKLGVYDKEFKGFYIYSDEKIEVEKLISKGFDAIKNDVEVEEVRFESSVI